MNLIYNELGIEVTRRCNQQCSNFCMRGPMQNLDISLDAIDLFLDQERNHYKIIRSLIFSGGEPCLNVPAISYTINKIISKQLPVHHVSLMTNGLIYSNELVNSFEMFNDYYNSTILPRLLSSLPPQLREQIRGEGSSIGFSNDQFHQPMSDEVLSAYLENGPNISYSMTGTRNEDEILHSGFSKRGRNLSVTDDNVRIFGNEVIDLIYLTAKGNLTTYGDGSFEFLDEVSANFPITDYTLNDFCFEKLSRSSRVGENDPIFRGKTKFLRKKV